MSSEEIPDQWSARPERTSEAFQKAGQLHTTRGAVEEVEKSETLQTTRI